MFDLNLLKTFPDSPGVYIMKNKKEEIIYVGKAICLRKRVSQYFNGQDKRLKISYLQKEVETIEYVVTNDNKEALLLENNLIKENCPKYNTLLKDDKTYPYIEITLQEDFPRIRISRKIENKKSKYFGPFPDSKVVNEIVNILNKTFKLRTCENMSKKGCLYESLNLCSTPCKKKISKEDYLKNVNKCISILNGKSKDIIKDYKEKMLNFSNNLEFEKANECKKILEGFEYIVSSQRVINKGDLDEDVVVCVNKDKKTVIVVFFLRDGKIIGKRHFFMNNGEDELKADLVSSFIRQYYLGVSSIPKKIILEESLNDVEDLKYLLEEVAGRKIEFIVPIKADKKKLVDLALQNANIIINESINKEVLKKQKEEVGLKNLEKLLDVSSLSRIESYDISNTGGSLNVASMIVFTNGKKDKKSYRKFKLETKGANDVGCMKEVIKRRFTDETLSKITPNVLFIDGAENQVNAVKEVLNELGLNIKVCGMVKDDHHNTRALLYEDIELDIKKSSPEFKLITNIQDETHDFAINYHKLLRTKQMTHSKLDDIKGIGKVLRTRLLEEFQSLENIKNAPIEELTKIPGITEDLAKKIKESL